jgi:hypothetical protein
MNKVMLFSIADRLRLVFQKKKNTKYHQSIPIEILVCCVIFKIVQAANFLTCNEFVAIGKLTIFIILCEFVIAFISTYNDLITWPQGKTMVICHG